MREADSCVQDCYSDTAENHTCEEVLRGETKRGTMKKRWIKVDEFL